AAQRAGDGHAAGACSGRPLLAALWRGCALSRLRGDALRPARRIPLPGPPAAPSTGRIAHRAPRRTARGVLLLVAAGRRAGARRGHGPAADGSRQAALAPAAARLGASVILAVSVRFALFARDVA